MGQIYLHIQNTYMKAWGLRFVKMLPNYLDYVRSLNHASFIEWLNPDTIKIANQ
jgi:hypothetical protein